MTIHMGEVHQPKSVTRWLTPAFTIIRTHRRAYVWLNIMYYGLIGVGMLYATFNPALQKLITDAMGTAFSQGPLAAVGEALLTRLGGDGGTLVLVGVQIDLITLAHELAEQ